VLFPESFRLMECKTANSYAVSFNLDSLARMFMRSGKILVVGCLMLNKAFTWPAAAVSGIQNLASSIGHKGE